MITLLTALACAKQPSLREANIQEPPPWMTDRATEIRLEVVETLLDQRNTVTALEILEAMKADGLTDPQIDLLAGRALRIDGLFEDAEVTLQRADKRLRRDARPAAELCVLYADSERIAEAIDACRLAVRRDERDARSWNNLGFLLLSTNAVEEAHEAAGKAVQVEGANPLYRNNLAMAQAALGRADVAFRTFSSTLPQASAAMNVAISLERFDHLERALSYYRRALSFDPNLADAKSAVERLSPSAPLSTAPNGDSQ